MRLSSDLRAVYDRVFLAFLLHRPVDDSFLTRYELKTNFNIFFSHCYLTSYVSRIFSPLLSNLRAVYDRITVFFFIGMFSFVSVILSETNVSYLVLFILLS